MPESARAPVCLPQGFCTHTGSQGPVLGCTGAPGPFLSDDPMRALQLVRLAAESGCAAEWDCFAAAMDAAPALVHADPLAVRDELNRALTGLCPQALAPLVQAGGLRGVGIRGCACLHPLAQAPSGLLSRWWLFLRLCGADAEQAARRMKLGQTFSQDYARLDELFRAGPPADRLALKRCLAEGAPLPAEEMAALFSLLAPGWEPIVALYRELLDSRQPFSPDQLAVTQAELMAEGVSARKAGKVLSMLLKVVVEQPELNVAPVLLQLGRSLARFI